MGKIVFKVRDYPWQWSEMAGHCYTVDDLNELVNLKYTGGSLIEIYDESLRYNIKNQSKDFFYPIGKEIKSLYGSYWLYSYTYKLPRNINSDYLELRTGTAQSARFKLINTLPDTEENKKSLELYLSYFDELDSLYAEDICSDELYESLLYLFGDGKNRPRYSYMASIADNLLKLLPQLSSGLRKILVGKRQMLPISRVKELDSSCIRFLIRQPGDTIQEKTAANDFKMLAIARVEKFDLLENRVLKDFVIRAEREITDYISEFKDNQELLNSERVRAVRHVKQLLSEFKRMPVFELITRQKSLPTPNYVLQNERRYKFIWTYYLNLIRKERQREAAFKFQDYTFKDVCELFLQAALCNLVNNRSQKFAVSLLGTSFIKIFKEQHFGRRIASEAVGPFLLTLGNGKCYHIQIWTRAFKHSEIYPQNEKLKFLGTTTFIKFEDLSEGLRKDLIVPVYSINLAQADKKDDLAAVFDNAVSELKKAQNHPSLRDIRLGGLVLSKNDSSYNNCIKDGFGCFSISVNPNDWAKNLEELGEFLSKYLEAML